MEVSWFTLVISLSIIFLTKSLFSVLFSRSKLPPGPPSFPIVGNLQLFRTSFTDLENILKRLRSIYGPIVLLRFGSRKAIFISTSDLAHKTLIHLGATFADRPPAVTTAKILTSNQHNISTAPYGPLWRLLRRNLSAELLHPSRVKSFSPARKWVLDILIKNLKFDSGSDSDSGQLVPVMKHFQYAMFCLLVFMCFGEKIDDKVIREIESTQRVQLLSFRRFVILNFFPEKLGKFLLRKKWNQFMTMRGNQEKVLLPLIKARQEIEKKLLDDKEKAAYNESSSSDMVVCYVDTLLNMTIPENGGRKLYDMEIVSLCSEFLNAGTDTTTTALQWIMANLVKHPFVMSKLFEEVKQVMRNDDGEKVREEDLAQLKYLKAVVLEALRRHPPGHFVLPHAVTEEVQLDGYVVPKDASVNYMVAEIGCDPKVWEDPMSFKPERFMDEGEVFDITGSKEIKMMPFGAGRRICPGLGLALLHLEYFVANLVAEFEWKAENGCDVDLSEKQEFTMVMKKPLKALISPRVT